MACAICKLPLDEHQSALGVLGELPFDTVRSVMEHQWRKDITRIIYAHAEYYHDQNMFKFKFRGLCPSHKRQIRLIEGDIKRHRAKYIMHYTHAAIEAHRHEGIGATKIMKHDEKWIHDELKKALDYKLPKKLDTLFREAKPYAWNVPVTEEQSKQCCENMQMAAMEDHMFSHEYVHEVISRRLITVISITVRLRWDDETPELVPKTPDVMWCWNQTTGHIEEFQPMTKMDLL
ncbi:hypothetical protein F4777DRAFT_572167 [Nemania sp. FL0916]|nr:hypothetical protein F4777DRAFT_572167 [Nemania sp. FL0916]